MSDPFKATVLPNGAKLTLKQMTGMGNLEDKYTITIQGKKYPILLLNKKKDGYVLLGRKRDEVTKSIGSDMNKYSAFMMQQNLSPEIFSVLNTYTDRKKLKEDISQSPMYKRALRGSDNPKGETKSDPPPPPPAAP